MSKTRNMIMTLTEQFQHEHSALVAVENLKCLESLSIYAPGHLSFKPYVQSTTERHTVNESGHKRCRARCLLNAMSKGAEQVITEADGHFEDVFGPA
ncbi:hypothetical protein MRB53_039615 [Persea americana]|nr:hypothetical protein MRB53_039615 [Persea americana]